MSETPLYMRFYETSFIDFDFDHEGHSAAIMALTKYGKKHHAEIAIPFLRKYVVLKSHMHSALCSEALKVVKERYAA